MMRIFATGKRRGRSDQNEKVVSKNPKSSNGSQSGSDDLVVLSNTADILSVLGMVMRSLRPRLDEEVHILLREELLRCYKFLSRESLIHTIEFQPGKPQNSRICHSARSNLFHTLTA